MFNFRENKIKQFSRRNAAEMLMRTDLSVCVTWALGLGIGVCRYKEPAP